MKLLIIGFGSIAKKHVEAINKIDSDATIYALRSNESVTEAGIHNIYSWSEVPRDVDFIIISNPTSKHAETIKKCVNYNVPLFIEKPVFDRLDESEEILKLVQENNLITYVACNLRFHPAINYIKKEISLNPPIEYNSYCGSYLPDWRPDKDYRDIYSSKKELGGGVHLDLIHELDYCIYLLGNPNSTSCYLRKKSKLDINSIDIAHYVLEFYHTSAFITLNYYRRDAKREIECVWEDKTWLIDLIQNEITNQDGDIIYSEPFDLMETYTAQLRYFIDNISKQKLPENDLEQGINILSVALNV